MKKKIAIVLACILGALSIIFSVWFRYPAESLGDMNAPDWTEEIPIVEDTIEIESAAASLKETTVLIETTTEPATEAITEVVTTESETTYQAPATTPPQITDPDPYANLNYIWEFLGYNFNWSAETRAGIIGNIIVECSMSLQITDANIYAWNSMESGYGICQWNSGRRETLFAMYGTNKPDLAQQLAYMKYEMYGEYGTACQFISGTWARDELLSTNSPERAAYLFAVHFERCSPASYGDRQYWARQVYEYFVGKN